MNALKLFATFTIFLACMLTASALPATHIVISEVLYNAETGSENGKEWIELYNPTGSSVDIGNWALYKEGIITPLVQFSAGTQFPAHSYILIADDATLPPNLPTPDYITGVSTLSNSGDGIMLQDDNLNIVDAVGWGGITDTDFYEGTKIQGAPDGNSVEREQGGICGNAEDTNNNANDFNFNAHPTPQNSANATIVPCGPDLIPPGSVTGLGATNVTNETIIWEWTNPIDSDFDGTILFIDGVNLANFSSVADNVEVSGLAANTEYTITLHTQDTSGNVNDTNVSDTVRTLAVAECVIHEDCNNNLFCDGVEICNAGFCEAGTPVVCDNGQFCDGTETCNEVTDSCDAGTPVDIDDGIACTADSCDETNDIVVHTPQHNVCDNGDFCDGSETCDVNLGCQAGTPVTCDDGQFCNGVETCNEATDSCDSGSAPTDDDGIACTQESCNEVTDSIDHIPVDSLCDNGLFCDGTETCDVTLGCQAGTAFDCSANNINGIDTCTHNPDNDPLTRDTRSAFISTCNEATDSCEVGDTTVVSACSLTCGAGCESNLDCAANEVCDLNSCGCVPDNLPRVTIDAPAQSSTVNDTKVTVSFSTENFNVSGKGQDHIYFTFNGISGLATNDKLNFYNSPDDIVEKNDNPGTTVYATWLTDSSLQLNNVDEGLHTISAQIVYANGTEPDHEGANDSVSYNHIRPPAPVCGDNEINTGSEICDRIDLGGITCSDLGYSNPAGLACSATCDAFDTSSCVATCGDGNLEPTEQCDDSNTADGDGCSSTCELEGKDDLQINYARGTASFDGVAADNVGYTVNVTDGDNKGVIYTGTITNGAFDSLDQIGFSTGDSFRVTAHACTDSYDGTFTHGGDRGIHLDCRVNPVVLSNEYFPENPHDLEDTTVTANITDNIGVSAVVINYAINDTNFTDPMNLVSGLYTFNFGTLDYDTNVSYTIEVTDSFSNVVETDAQSFNVISLDFDKDGSNFTLDCNDHDATIYPGAPEIVDTIDQNCVNDAPVFTGPIPNQSWNEDTDNLNAFDLDAYFTDVDDDGLLTYSFSTLTDINASINGNNEVSFTQPEHFHGIENVVLTASDSKTTVDSNSVELSVESVNDIPVFNGTLANVEVREKDLVDLNATAALTASDADEDVLTISYACGAGCGIAQNGTWLTNYGDAGAYDVNVTVSDGTDSTTQSAQITVLVRKTGDVTGDGSVDISDLVVIIRALDSTPADANWNEIYDLFPDGIIDISDMVIVIQNLE